jgi:hypothetical protein
MHGTQPLAGNCVRSIVGRSKENQPCTPTLFAKRRGSALRMRSRITGQGILDAIVGSALKSPARISSYRQLHHVVLPFRPDSERCAWWCKSAQSGMPPEQTERQACSFFFYRRHLRPKRRDGLHRLHFCRATFRARTARVHWVQSRSARCCGIM